MKIHSVVCDGRLYIRADNSGIDPLKRMVDQIPMFTFGKSRKPYIEAETLIQWHQLEYNRYGNTMHLEAVNKLEEAKQLFLTNTENR